jgi:CRISPR-associated protein Cas8a1/Csx13
MGKKKPEVIPEQVTISLSDPGMTALHKVGLAGLWMTLKAFEQDGALMRRVPSGAGWKLDDRSVALVCSQEPRRLFDWLIQESFKLDKNGLFWFPALGRPADNVQQAVVLQAALLGTFLQHGLTRKADSSTDQKGSVNTVIDDLPHVLRYRKVTSYAHQKQDIVPGKPVQLAGWCLPGGSERHTAFGETKLAETDARALTLRFAPVGAICFEIRTRGQGVRPAYSLVLPEVSDLKQYARARSRFLQYGVKQLYAAGSADAGMRVLAEMHAAGLLPDLRSAQCRVMSFGTVPWSTKQKTRVQLFTVRAGAEDALTLYRKCANWLPSSLVRREGKEPLWDVPLVPDLVARNISAGVAWYSSFAELIADNDRGDRVLGFIRDRRRRLIGIRTGEKGGLATMIADKTTFPEGPERTFVLACHEAWRRRMGQIGDKARREGSSFHDQVQREFVRMRTSFARCKNATTLREAVTDFWARAGGPIAPLQQGWSDVLMLMDERNWRKAKDLALLALASYKPASKDEASALEAEPRDTEKGGTI